MDDADDPPGLTRIELEPDEERGLGRLAAAMGIVGLIQLLGAGIILLLMVIGLFTTIGQVFGAGPARIVAMAMGLAYAALPIWQGVMLREAGEVIGRVGGPDQEDQDFLVSAFRRLKVVFLIELLLALWHLYEKLG